MNQPRWTLTLASLTVALLCVSAHGAEPDNSLFDGQWSLSLQISTRPGGETLEGNNVVTSPFYVQITAENPSFTVSQEGKFSWDGRDSGRSKVVKHGIYPRGVTDDVSEQTRVLLKAQGTVSEQRVLTMDPQWTIGAGQFTNINNRGVIYIGSYTVSDDGGTLTIRGTTNVSPSVQTYSAPVSYEGKPWELAPASIEEREIAPDVIREEATYRAQRQGTYAGTVPVTERIEIKQIRYLKLIPRG